MEMIPMNFKKGIIKIALLLMSAFILVTAIASCKKDEEGEKEDPAVTEVKTFLTEYLATLNSKKYDELSKYYQNTDNVTQMAENFSFMTNYFETTYELLDVSAVYLDDGNISASVSVKRTSKKLENGETTVYKDPSSYLFGKTESGLVIISYSEGESEILNME